MLITFSVLTLAAGGLTAVVGCLISQLTVDMIDFFALTSTHNEGVLLLKGINYLTVKQLFLK